MTYCEPEDVIKFVNIDPEEFGLESEGELEEKEGTVISIKRDLINGAGWTVQDAA